MQSIDRQESIKDLEMEHNKEQDAGVHHKLHTALLLLFLHHPSYNKNQLFSFDPLPLPPLSSLNGLSHETPHNEQHRVSLEQGLNQPHPFNDVQLTIMPMRVRTLKQGLLLHACFRGLMTMVVRNKCVLNVKSHLNDNSMLRRCAGGLRLGLPESCSASSLARCFYAIPIGIIGVK
jgi:hypothetical protein